MRNARRGRYRSTGGRLLAALLAGVWIVTAAAGGAAAQSARESERRHQDWGEACERSGGGEVCFIFQRLKYQGQTAANVTIGYKPGAEGPVMVVNLPLGAVSLPEGLRIETDKGVDAWTPFLFCSERGCHAEMEIDPKLLAAMRAGAEAHVIVRELSGGEEARLPMSLLGFTAGLQSLRSG